MLMNYKSFLVFAIVIVSNGIVSQTYFSEADISATFPIIFGIIKAVAVAFFVV